MQRPWTIRPGNPNRPSEFVVEVDREIVAGRSRVAGRLVVGDGIGDLRERTVAVDVESMVRRALADALDASMPRKNSVTYCSFTSAAVLVARLGA